MTTIIPGLYGLDSASAFRALQKDPQKYIDRFSKDKSVQKEMEYFQKVAPKLTSIDALMKDRRALQFVLDSYGMGSEINNAGRIRKVLTEDPTLSTSLVNKLVDPKFKAMATSLRLDQGMGKLTQSTSLSSVEGQFVQHELQESLGSIGSNISATAKEESAYFSYASASFKTADDLFRDKRALKFVLDSYGLGTDINDVSKLKTILTEDPTKSTSQVNKLTDKRYLQMAADLRLDLNTDKLKSDAYATKLEQNFISTTTKSAFTTLYGASEGATKMAAITANARKEIDYFNKAATQFNSVDSLLKDTRATQYLLDAYNLGSSIDDTDKLKKVLSEDPTAKNSFVSTLSDPAFKKMATDLRLDTSMGKLTKVDFLDTLKTNYIQNKFEEALGSQDNALRQAAYFARNAGSISNVYSVLGDKVLRDVVTKTFNLPDQLAVQAIESQARVIASRVDVTKFNTSGTNSVSASQLSRAKSDHDILGKNLSISDAANKQIKTIQDTMAQLANDYANLADRTDPSGPNAATIAIQQDAVPEMVRYEQLLRAGGSAIGSMQTNLTSLQNLIKDAQKSGSDMNALKSQFSAIVSSINSKIDGATITAPDGSSQNILLNGSADVLTTVYDDQNSSVSLNRYDATGLKSLLSEAEAAFTAATGSADSGNLNTALSRLLRTEDGTKVIADQMTKDATALDNASASGFFAATLNTTSLTKGQQSVNDGLSRITQIETLLKQIGNLANASKALPADGDRTAMEAQFETYKTQLSSLIENTGSAGLDNFLNNLPTQNYEIINGKNVQVKGGFDLKALVSDVINTKNLSNATDASDLEIATIQVTTYTDRAKNSLNASKPLVDSVIGHYDPRGKLDSQITDLKNNIDVLINGASVYGQNLLSADQKKIQLSISTGNNVTFNTIGMFKQDLSDSLDSIISQLGNGSGNVLNAIDDALTMLNQTKRKLDSDNRVATIEYGRLAGTIDALDTTNTAKSSTMYQTNAFTAKFISRYLVMNGSDGSTSGSSNNYLAALFGSTDNNAAMGNLMSLAVSLRA